MYYILLIIAIVAELVGTLALKSSEGFTRLGPSLMVLIGYSTAFYCLSLILKSIPIGVIYAIWSGLGIVLVTIAGWLFFGQKLDAASILGISLIVIGAVVIQLFSATAHH